MADFALVALPGAYHSSVGALTDSFGLARDRVEQVFSGFEPVLMETKLRILSSDGGPVLLSDGARLEVTGTFGGDEIYAFVFLPAFRAGGTEPMADRIAHNRPLLDWLRRQAEGGAVIGASGTAAALLIAAGLTRDMAVPVSRALLPLIRQMFPRQRIEERAALVDHGHLLVANGFATDFALIVRVMEQTLSPDVAHWLASVIGLAEVEEALVPTDPLVARALLWLEQRYTGDANVAELAAALSTSQATLNRRFRKAMGLSPGGYVQELRLRSACEMLKKSSRSIDRIAQLVGYSDSRLFRAMFRRQTGMTATRWRTEARAGGKQ